MTETEYEWRDSYPDEEVRWQIVCEGSAPTSLGSYLTMDEFRGAVLANHGADSAEYAALVASTPKAHKPFRIGTVTMDRDGRVKIRPRWAETLIVDPDTRKVHLRCRCRTALGECKYAQTLSLDYLIVALTQMSYDGADIHSGPVDFLTITWSVSEWLVGTLDADEQAEWDVKKARGIAAYRARRKPEELQDSKGRPIMALP